jgi:hypothetical protein
MPWTGSPHTARDTPRLVKGTKLSEVAAAAAAADSCEDHPLNIQFLMIAKLAASQHLVILIVIAYQ